MHEHHLYLFGEPATLEGFPSRGLSFDGEDELAVTSEAHAQLVKFWPEELASINLDSIDPLELRAELVKLLRLRYWYADTNDQDTGIVLVVGSLQHAHYDVQVLHDAGVRVDQQFDWIDERGNEKSHRGLQYKPRHNQAPQSQKPKAQKTAWGRSK